jgi:predicted alpha/beta hydrolase family esterase
MPDEGNPNPLGWKQVIARELENLSGDVILVGHSIGAAILVDYLVDARERRRPAAVFLIANPFIGDQGWPSKDLRPTKEAAAQLPEAVPICAYHGDEDDTVPVSHLGMFAKAFPRAIIRRLEGRNHQLNDDLSELAYDIKRLGGLFRERSQARD